MSTLFSMPKIQAFNSSGDPISGAQLYFYETATSTPLAVYQDVDLNTAHAQPVLSDAYGVFPAIWLGANPYRVVLQDSAGLTLWTVDGITGSASSGTGTGNFPISDLETAAGVTIVDSTEYYGNVRRYGAQGDGSTADTAAFEAALLTGHDVSGRTGDVYMIDPLVANIAGVTINFTGCTLKLISPSPGGYMLDLTADNITVNGGTFDGNNGETHTTADYFYDHACVRLYGDGCTVENIWAKDSAGIGIKGGAHDRLTVRNCRITGWQVQGIFLSNGTTAHHYDWRVEGNYITVGYNTGVGIYLNATSPYTYVPKRWIVSGNTVVGPDSNSKSDIDFCATIFGSEGVCSNNSFYGCCCGVSAVLTDSSTFVGNRFIDQNIDQSSKAAFGLELSGGQNTVSGNVFVNGNQGVAMNTLRRSDSNTITGNIFKDQRETTVQAGMGVFISAANGADLTNISNNSFTSAFDPWAAVYIAGEANFTHISGNNICGTGGSNTFAVYMDNGAGYLSVVNNKISQVERPVTLYGSVTYVDVTFVGNDCNEDTVTDPATLVALDGGAAYGDNISVVSNAMSGVSFDYIDRANNVIRGVGDGSPEGVIVASGGSLWQRRDAGGDATLYVKSYSAGTENTSTGWHKVNTTAA